MLLVTLLLTISLLMVVILERKFLASMQGREGPSVAGFMGLFQTAVDGLKVFFKNIVFSRRAFKVAFFILPLFLMFLNFVKVMYVPTSLSGGVVDFEYDILFIYMLTSIDVLVFVLASWSSFTSKFPTFAAVRELAQMCSFELIYGFCILAVIMHAGSLCLRTCMVAQEFVWFFFIITPYTFLFFISMLAESHRVPVDTSESESELVAGYQTEYGGFNFSFFYLAEYGGLIISSIIFSILFFGGWGVIFLASGLDIILTIKVGLVLSTALLVRCASPRVRLKTAMGVAWTQLLPLSNILLPFYLWVSYVFDSTRPTEYIFMKSRAFTAWVGGLYYSSFSAWFRRLANGRDLRRDTASTNIATKDVVSAKLFLNWLSSKRSGNSGISPLTYPYDRNLVDSLTVGGVNTYLGKARAEVSESIPLFNAHAALRGSMYETFLSLFNRSKFTELDTTLPNRFQSYCLNRDVRQFLNSEDTIEGRERLSVQMDEVAGRISSLERSITKPEFDSAGITDVDTLTKMYEDHKIKLKEFNERLESGLVDKVAGEIEDLRLKATSLAHEYERFSGRLGKWPPQLIFMAGLAGSPHGDLSFGNVLDFWLDRQHLVDKAKQSRYDVGGFGVARLRDENIFHYFVNGPNLLSLIAPYDNLVNEGFHDEDPWMRVLERAVRGRDVCNRNLTEIRLASSTPEGFNTFVTQDVNRELFDENTTLSQYGDYIQRYRHGWFYEHGRDLTPATARDENLE